MHCHCFEVELQQAIIAKLPICFQNWRGLAFMLWLLEKIGKRKREGSGDGVDGGEGGGDGDLLDAEVEEGEVGLRMAGRRKERKSVGMERRGEEAVGDGGQGGVWETDVVDGGDELCRGWGGERWLMRWVEGR
ncbi:hypothetical protein Tsubulata_030421 [Turnera subulata]|uniref:Uncharacterized protein n=1 Tax=Turnera subulata TaxID=218843 RepID=A0A9Q0J3E8_9ROSI|nr:hypothetical protein Tsubulata_030421 [Turnera subulata]